MRSLSYISVLKLSTERENLHVPINLLYSTESIDQFEQSLKSNNCTHQTFSITSMIDHIIIFCFLALLQAFSKSLDPEILDIILSVLYVENMDKVQHARKLQQYYHEQINLHEQCEKCRSSPI